MSGTDEKRLAISLKKVGVAYKRRAGFMRSEKFWALENVSFDVFHGETLGVIGKNGAGKSTILQLLAGISTPDRGKVIHLDVTASLLSLQVGFIPHMTGRENAMLSGMLLGLSKNQIMELMDDILNYSGLGSSFERNVGEYSTGMRARLGFSTAIHVDPDVLLIDEVLGVGDEDFKRQSTSTMKEKIRSNKTVVIVSHNLPVIRELCDRMVWIEKGEVIAMGEPEEIISHYIAKK